MVTLPDIVDSVHKSFEYSLSNFTGFDLHSRANTHVVLGVINMMGKQCVSIDDEVILMNAGLELARHVNETRWTAIAKVPVDYTQHRNPQEQWLCLQSTRAQLFATVRSSSLIEIMVFGVR